MLKHSEYISLHRITVYATILVVLLVTGRSLFPAWLARADDSAERSALITLARRAGFRDLTKCEVRLLESVALQSVNGGESIAHCEASEANSDPLNNVETGGTWPKDRTVRASLIRWLALDPKAASRVDPVGIRLIYARITGNLLLNFANLPFSIGIRHSYFDDQIMMPWAQVDVLDLKGSRVNGIAAQGLKVRGSLFLDEGFRSDDVVDLQLAEINGNVEGMGATIRSGAKSRQVDSLVLMLESAKVGGNIRLAGIRADGYISLIGATIGGELGIKEGTIKNPHHYALIGDRAKVEGSVFLNGFHAEGEIHFVGANIALGLYANQMVIKSSPKDGEAFDFDNSKTGGDVQLTGLSVTDGLMRLAGAHLGGGLFILGGTIRDLEASGIFTDKSMLLGGGLYVLGVLTANDAIVSHDLTISNVEFGGRSLSGLSIERTTVKGIFSWQNIKAKEGTVLQLDLNDASVGSLADDQSSWPKPGQLDLDGFSYDRISGGPIDAKSRLAWLALQQPKFAPEPYNQLAETLRKAGEGAYQVLIGLQNSRWNLVKLGVWERCRLFISWLTIRYGYEPWWALPWSLVVVAIGALLFRCGYKCGFVSPCSADAYSSFTPERRLPPYYQSFNSLAYSLDTFLPIINIHQKDSWLPNPNIGGWGRALRFWLWVEIGLGWILTTLFVAGFTGLVK